MVQSTQFLLKDINFGDIDGRNEAKLQNFESLFYHRDELGNDNENSEYNQLVKSNKFLILGRKGTGKTILVSYIKEKLSHDNNSDISLLDINDFIDKKLKVFDEQDIRNEEMDNFWKHVFLLEFSEQILRNKVELCILLSPYLRKLRIELKRVKEFLTESIDTTSKSYNLGANVKNTVQTGISSSSEIKYNKVHSNKYYHLTSELEKLIINYMNLPFSRKRRVIVYDDIDELYDKVKNRDFFINIMNSMIRTAAKFNNNLYLKGNGLKVCLVLRKDLIKELQLNSSNLNKIAKSSAIDINWIEKFNDLDKINNPLTKLITHKIKHSLALTNYDHDQIYDIFLSQESGGNSIMDILLEHSFGRPRDMISFLKIYQEKYPEDSKLYIKHIKKCTKEYSEWFYDELMNEIHILDNKDEIKEVINAIQEMKKEKFSIEELKNFINNSNRKYDISNLENCLDKLYELSFIGNRSRNGNIEFNYRLNHSSRANFNHFFIIHRAIKPYLSI